MDLISKDSKGKFRIVSINYDWNEEQHGFIIQRITGLLHGKLQNQPEILITRGKSNRTVTEQVKLEYASWIKKYKDKSYKELNAPIDHYSEEELNEIVGDVKTNQLGVIKPQLAKQAEKVTNTKIFDKEWLISRKLDGVKALFYYKDGEIHTASRGGEHYDYATTHLRTNLILTEFFKHHPNIILDGELFKRGVSLQRISGAARMEENAYDCDWLEYWIYDCYDQDNPDISAEQRWEFLVGCSNIPMFINDDVESPIKLLHHQFVSGWNNMKKLHDQWVSDGFEGAVITDPDKPYKPGSRCNNLIKIKEYKSDDFLVIGYELGLRGSEDMAFICQLEDGRTFKAMPVGDRQIKQEYVDNFEKKYKNHKAECTFFNYSDDGMVTQPKLRVFRFDLE